MNQSGRTLDYHLGRLTEFLGGVEGTRQKNRWKDFLTEFPDRLNREHDPNQQAEQVELRCLACGRVYEVHTFAEWLDCDYLLEARDEAEHETHREYDPTQETERVELRCPVCGRVKCPLDVK